MGPWFSPERLAPAPAIGDATAGGDGADMPNGQGGRDRTPSTADLDATREQGAQHPRSGVGDPGGGHAWRPPTSADGRGKAWYRELSDAKLPRGARAEPRADRGHGGREAPATKGLGGGMGPRWACCLPRPLRWGFRARCVASAPAEEEMTKGRDRKG